MSADDFPDVRHPIADQADDYVDESTTSAELCGQLDFGLYERDDRHRESEQAASFAPMIAARFLQALEGYSDPELHQKLQDAEVATALGFDPDDLPSRSTFTRARNGRFADCEDSIERARGQIRQLAAARGSPIGPAFTPEDRGSSKRTRHRLLREKALEVLEQMEQVVFPALSLPRAEEPIYGEEELLKLETFIAIQRAAANDGAVGYGDMLDPDAELGPEDPFYEDGPTGETLLEAIKEVTPEAITKMVNKAAYRTITRAKPHDEFNRPVMLALDITYVAYYGDRDEMIHVQGAPDDKEYDWCHKFATANIVGDNVHFTVAMLPVGNAHYHDPDAYSSGDASYRVGDVVRQLIDRASDLVSIRRVYADREFYAADAIAALEERRLNYVIPVPIRDRLKSELERMPDDQVSVKHEYGFYGPLRHGSSNERVETTLVVLPPDEQRDHDQPFATNLDVDDTIGVDRRSTKRRIKRYQNRGGIENAYKKIKEFAAWTTSKEFGVRLFHFGFAVLLYNMWLLVDFLVQVSIEGEVRSKPRITAGRLRGFLDRRVSALL
jgi:hypothetical protein